MLTRESTLSRLYRSRINIRDASFREDLFRNDVEIFVPFTEVHLKLNIETNLHRARLCNHRFADEKESRRSLW